jgi:hypothetical protein
MMEELLDSHIHKSMLAIQSNMILTVVKFFNGLKMTQEILGLLLEETMLVELVKFNMLKDILEVMILFILKIAMVKHSQQEKIMFLSLVLERNH